MSSRTHRIAEPVPYRAGLTGTHPGQESYVELGTARVRMVFCWCPPTDGFLMGSPPDEPERTNHETLHEVKLTHGFWIAKYPVTQRQWLAVMPAEKSSLRGKVDHLPLGSMSWNMIQTFFKRASKRGASLRLPTEAQWEYACRAGSSEPFGVSVGNALNSQLANFAGSKSYGSGVSSFKWLDRGDTMPVASFPPNAWGLHDMHGQLWEWCEDSYTRFLESKAIDPLGAGGEGRLRILRGGSWVDVGREVRAACRIDDIPARAADNFGFRPCASSIEH